MRRVGTTTGPMGFPTTRRKRPRLHILRLSSTATTLRERPHVHPTPTSCPSQHSVHRPVRLHRSLRPQFQLSQSTSPWQCHLPRCQRPLRQPFLRQHPRPRWSSPTGSQKMTHSQCKPLYASPALRASHQWQPRQAPVRLTVFPQRSQRPSPLQCHPLCPRRRR